jgi:hypothetical protein
MWGGQYNPIIPVDDYDLAASLVRLFRVDILWPVVNDEKVRAFISRFPHLREPFRVSEPFIEYDVGVLGAQLLDIRHPIHRLRQEQLARNANSKVKVKIYQWHRDDPLRAVLIATLGALPATQVTGTDYLELLRQDLDAETISLSQVAPIPPREETERTISSFSRAFVEPHYSVRNDLGQPGFYVGKAQDFDDLAAFWNLRATGTHLMFYDPEHADRLEPDRIKYLEMLQARPKERHERDNLIAVWITGERPRWTENLFGEKILLRTVWPSIWNGANVIPAYMHFSEHSALGAVDERADGSWAVSFQLPTKPFSDQDRQGAQHLVVSIDAGMGSILSEHATLEAPYIPELNEYYGRRCYFEFDCVRVEPNGLGIITEASCSHLALRALNVRNLVARILEFVSIAAEPSDAGLVATRLIQQMGGLQGCRPFKIPGVRTLIEKYGPDKSFTRSGAIEAIRGVDCETNVASFSLHENLFIDARPTGKKLMPDHVLADLLEKEVFRVGLSFECPACKLKFWTSLDDVGSYTTCDYCGNRFNVAPYLRDRDWAFRRSGLFGHKDDQHGAIPVALTLQQLQTRFFYQFFYATGIKLKPLKARINECETDFVALLRHPADEATHIAIGECKTRMPITDQDVTNLKMVADAFPEDRFKVFLIFSKLESFSPEELVRLQKANNKHYQRVILFTPRELEPYDLYERVPDEYGIDKHVMTFEGMAKNTEKIFFNTIC